MKKKTYKLPTKFKPPVNSLSTPTLPNPVSNLSFFSLPPPPQLTNNSGFFEYIKYGFLSFHQQIQYLNNSKLFAGLIVIILNIAGKFVNFKLSKTMESYMKHTFSRNILIFCIAWMGSREIYIAFLITFLCILFMDFVCNENSGYCMLPETFKNYHISLLDKSKPTNEEIKNAKEILERAGENYTLNKKSNTV
jgi:hypothetical protein